MLGRRILGQMRNQMRRKSYLINSGPGPEVNSFAELQVHLNNCFEEYGKTPPRGLVFLCGDAHNRPPYLCDLVGQMIVDGKLPFKIPAKETPYAALHVELPGNSVGLSVGMEPGMPALNALGLTLESKMVFGFEPLGFVLYSRFDYALADVKTPNESEAKKILADLKGSEAYWTQVGEDWTENIKRTLVELDAKFRDELKMVEAGKDDDEIITARLSAGSKHRTAVINARVPANTVIGKAIQESIDIAASRGAILHFVSVGNDHLEGPVGKGIKKGHTIIKHVGKMDSDDWLAFSIGKGKMEEPEVKTIGTKGRDSGFCCVIA